ncbi:MAG: hypothetical protein H6638_01375 [Ardenticatenales bacterium]|nr:hypothetical protein [Ardenticatenales bacterium]MCB9172518.1 hypothetical protein [Ardenticatenales bacterium]
MSDRHTDDGWPLGWIVALIGLLLVAPMAAPGYWWGAHDARHAVYFLFEFSKSIADGIWWPRWSPDFAFGYGYPFFNVYGPLSAFVGQAWHSLGFDLVSATKASFALTMPLSGLAMYGFVKRLAGRGAGLVAAVVYMALPYHLAVLYVRAAMAEAWAFVFFPLVLWGFYAVATAPRPRTIALTALAYGGFFLAHPGLAMQATLLLIPWTLLWLLRALGEWRSLLTRTLAAAATALLGVVAAAIFVLPWLAESGYVNQEQWFAGYFNYSQHFIAPWQLLSPLWDFGTSEAGVVNDRFPFQLGIVPLLLATVGWMRLIREPRVRHGRIFFTALLAVALFLMVPASRWLWDSPFGQLILKPMQFPWRFLILSSVALAPLAGLSAWRLRPRWALLFAALMLIGSWGYLRVERIAPAEGPVGIAGLMRFQQSAGELTGQSACVALADIPTWSPLAELWVQGEDVTSRFDYGLLAEGAWAGNAQQRTTQEITEVQLPDAQRVGWLITDFPGWHVYQLALDSDAIIEELPIIQAERSCHIQVEAPAGHYRLLVRFENTPVRVVGQWLSALGLLGVALLLIIDKATASGALRRRVIAERGVKQGHSVGE